MKKLVYAELGGCRSFCDAYLLKQESSDAEIGWCKNWLMPKKKMLMQKLVDAEIGIAENLLMQKTEVMMQKSSDAEICESKM